MRVIVTRPQGDSQAWVRALSGQGLEAIALPLIDIHPVIDRSAMRAAWERLGEHSAVMFVSRSAVEHFFAAKLPSDGDLGAGSQTRTRFWVTGPGSAAALQSQGVDPACIDAPPVDGGQFDSESLWQLVAAQVEAADRVLIVRGADRAGAPSASGFTESSGAGSGRDWLAQRLAQAGARVAFLRAYDRAVPLFGAVQRRLATRAAADGSIWLFTSTQAVANLGACMPEQNWAAGRALATHPRIAAAARGAGFGVVLESRAGISDVAASIESVR